MNQRPPQGSNIEIDMVNGYQRILIPPKNPATTKYLTGVFLVLWLCAWFIAFINAINEIISGTAGVFLIFWLGLWSIGGILVIFYIYQIFRKSVPEQLLLNKPNLSINIGMTITISDLSGQDYYWKSILPKRRGIELNYNEIKTLKLRETKSGNRLTVDKGTERIEFAALATEVEREWLFQYLSKSYNLTL